MTGLVVWAASSVAWRLGSSSLRALLVLGCDGLEILRERAAS